jgi:transcription elongation factor Elf1
MNSHTPPPDGKKHWESAHVCPRCGHVLNLADIDLKAITTGVADCPNCDWSGPIAIRILDDKTSERAK